MTTGKTIALTRQTLVGKVMSLFFNMLSRLVIFFFPKGQASFNFMAEVTICCDFGAQENSLSLFPLFPLSLPWSDGTGSHDLGFLNAEYQASFFTLLFHIYQEALHFCHMCGIICKSQVIDVSSGNPDFSLCFIQPRISFDVLCI